MAASPTRPVTVDDRERAILELVRGTGGDGATVRSIYETVGERLGDGVTIQAYYKVLARMEAADRLEAVDDGSGERRYVLAPHLHADSALTLDDVYALLDELEPTDAIARVVDAREYFDERRRDTLARAARELQHEDPRELVERFLLDRFRALEHDVDMLEHRGAAGEKELRERALEGRVRSELRELQQLAYRNLGLSQAAIALPAEGRPTVDVEMLRAELARRVFGARAIELLDVNAVEDIHEWNRTAVAGTDGSTFASVLQITTAADYTSDVGSQAVTVNNAVAYVQRGASQRTEPGDSPYYSVPMNRQAIDDPTNRGMVMAPFMYRYLNESEYEKTAKCATDVVQWRADERVFAGQARALGTGVTLPRPKVHFRDGTITPQEREFNHYQRADEYGDMVREGIRHSRLILDRIVNARGPAVFAGAVKTTQVRLFASVLNWYIVRGSRERLGRPIDPDWDVTRAAHIADNEAMTILLSTLTPQRGAGQQWITFQVMRPFHSLTEYFSGNERDDPAEWVERFRRRQKRDQDLYGSGEEPYEPWMATVPSIEDEDYVVMCTSADYVSFYIGHTSGDPPPVVPRYEFMESLRSMSPEQAAARVARNVRLMVAALDRVGVAADRDHNFLSNKTLVKMMPFVVQQAHETGKSLGRQLEAELRSVVIANLLALRRAKDVKPGDVRFLPMSIRRFVERYRDALAERRDDLPSQR
jgi:hypothetical protein